MSSFLMSYPHGSMGTGGYEPKFPPSETDFHHLHHHHGGYSGMNGITTNHMDYSYHNHNGYNYGNYTPTPTTPFYHHHPPYGSPQMHHHTNAPSPNITPQSNTSYVANVLSNNNTSAVGNRNSSTTISTATTNTAAVAVVNGLNVSENSSNVDNSLGYYNSYYGTTNGHHDPQDLPLQCPSSEPPANTALGLHELGNEKYLLCVVKKV
jgi:homeobox protein HoxA/B/C/D4